MPVDDPVAEPARFYCMLSANRRTIHYSDTVAESYTERPALAKLTNHCLIHPPHG